LSGSVYGGVDGVGSLIVGEATSWLWKGTRLARGDVLPAALGGEFNHYSPTSASAPNVQILAQSPVGGGISDVTYVAQRGHGGVFSSGTGHWIYDLSDSPYLPWVPAAQPKVTAPIKLATRNVLALFGAGPAGIATPSVANASQYP
jgi:hypothetical protein